MKALVVAAAVLLAVTVAGCSSSKVTDGSTTVAAGQGEAKVTVDGKELAVSGDIGCVTTGDQVVLSVGDQSRGLVGATITAEKVQTLGLIIDGQPLAYATGVPGNAVALEKSGTTCHLSGDLTGMPDMSNAAAAPVKRAFTMDVKCPA